MTLQQLEYIIAVEQHGYFVNAAEACGVTQSTLSLMIKKLEEELDVKIFNRDTHPVTVTEMGRKVIDEAKMAVFHTKQLVEMTRSAKEQASGDLSIAMTMTVAPVLMPGLFHYMWTKNPAIRLRVEEICWRCRCIMNGFSLTFRQKMPCIRWKALSGSSRGN